MFTSSYIQVSNIFTIIGPISESTLKIISDTRGKILGNPIFEIKVVTLSGLTYEHYLQFKTIKDNFYWLL